jgi:nicotinamidase-related amidase
MPVVLTRAELNAPPLGRTVYSRPQPIIPDAALALIPALAPEPGDIIVGKRGWSPFSGTDLDQRLRALGVTQVVLAGLATSFGIESSARAAYDLDYHVVVAVDAITDPFVERHDYCVSAVFPIISELGASAEIVGLLDSR